MSNLGIANGGGFKGGGSAIVGELSFLCEDICYCKLSGTSVWRPQSRYTVSRIECRIKFPQNQRCRAKIALHPAKSRCRTFLWTPPSHFPLICSRQEAKGGVLRRAGGGYRGTFGFRKRIALHGGVAATVTPVALLCATKIARRFLLEFDASLAVATSG